MGWETIKNLLKIEQVSEQSERTAQEITEELREVMRDRNSLAPRLIKTKKGGGSGLNLQQELSNYDAKITRLRAELDARSNKDM
jgi:DNA anti-recombination protein RmuC